jgi:structural maintenance of chromosome 2
MKVLNMKPPEILSMLEEAAGTRMYETKRTNALKTLEKKDTKVAEINKVRDPPQPPAPTLPRRQCDSEEKRSWRRKRRSPH